jgi:glyceraldehyde 3-phosphate dehydrogenase
VDRAPIRVTSVPEPAELPWGELGVDVVVESTGRFVSRSDAARHLKAGARKVLVSAPGRDMDLSVVMGVNQGAYDPAHHDVISNASCTTNCVAPMVKVLHEAFGIVKGALTTVHGYTNDQVLLDAPHEDLRRARSAALNIVPTSTGATGTTEEIIPDLAGRLFGTAVRVPVETGSLTALTALLQRPVSIGEVNAVFLRAAQEELLGILRVTAEPVVSRDIVGDPVSCVLDLSLTKVDGELVEVFGWYDNEWGYANRLADLAEYVGRRL